MQHTHVSFTITNAVRVSFETFQKNLGLMVRLFTAMVVFMALGIAVFVVASFFGDHATVAICSLLAVFATWLLVGAVGVMLDASRGVEYLAVKNAVIYDPKRYIAAGAVAVLLAAPSFLITYLCNNFVDSTPLLVVLMLAYLCISAQCQFALYVAIEKQAWPWTAIVESWKLTRGHRLRVIGLLLAYEVVSLFGIVFVALYGVVAFMAITMLTLISAYQLSQQVHSH